MADTQECYVIETNHTSFSTGGLSILMQQIGANREIASRDETPARAPQGDCIAKEAWHFNKRIVLLGKNTLLLHAAQRKL